jgi:hypothetical protein
LCKRSDDDQLVRALTKRYKLNILRLPRRGVGIGELLIEEGKDLRCAGSIRKLFDPDLDMPAAEPVALPDIDGVTSARRSAHAAAQPLTGLLTTLGLAGVSSVDASLRAARDVSIAYSLIGTRYRRTDLVTLGDELASRELRRNNALYQPGREFYAAYAVAEATGIKVAFSTGTDRAASFAVELAALIKADASAAASTDHSGNLVISSREPVTFGLAVVQLNLDGDRLSFKTTTRLRAVRGKPSPVQTRQSVDSVLFGGADGDVLVAIS